MEVVILIDKLYIKKSFIYNEFDEVENSNQNYVKFKH